MATPNPQKALGQAAEVAPVQDTTQTVQRQIAAAQTGKAGTDLGGAQTNAATSATINTVQDRIAAGKTAALQRAQGIKQKRDALTQQGEAQKQQTASQQDSLTVDTEQQTQDIFARVSESGKDMSVKEKIQAGEQLDFMNQMKHDQTQADLARFRTARRNMTAQERRKSNALAGAEQALQDAIQEALFSQSEAKKARDFKETQDIEAALKSHRSALSKIKDQQNALMTSAATSMVKTGVAAYQATPDSPGDTNVGQGTVTRTPNPTPQASFNYTPEAGSGVRAPKPQAVPDYNNIFPKE